MTIYGELERALQTTPENLRDVATVSLAKRYAGALDDCFDQLIHDEDIAEDPAAHARKILEISRLGARFEAMLDRLQMAPAARQPIPRKGDEDPDVDPATAALDALRRDAESGAPSTGLDYAAFVDPAVAEADAED